MQCECGRRRSSVHSQRRRRERRASAVAVQHNAQFSGPQARGPLSQWTEAWPTQPAIHRPLIASSEPRAARLRTRDRESEAANSVQRASRAGSTTQYCQGGQQLTPIGPNPHPHNVHCHVLSAGSCSRALPIIPSARAAAPISELSCLASSTSLVSLPAHVQHIPPVSLPAHPPFSRPTPTPVEPTSVAMGAKARPPLVAESFDHAVRLFA